MKKLLFCLFLFTATWVSAQNDNCSEAILLTVGTDFNSNAITSSNTASTTDGDAPSCNADAAENVWFTVVVPPSGNLKIETREASGSLFDDSVLTVYSGTCNSLTEINCDDDDGEDLFSLISLTGQTPGATLYISVWKYDSDIENDDFQISAYEPVPPVNDDCLGAISLTVESNFTAGIITASNIDATTNGALPFCQSDSVDNVWFKVVVPASGNLKIETRDAPGSLFENSVLTVYSGNCGSLTEIDCNDDDGQDSFSLVSLTGQTPGTTLYIAVWKYSDPDSPSSNGEFQISAYDNSILSTSEISKSARNPQVSPNPFRDILTISDISDVKSVSVMDISGRLVKTIEKPSSILNLEDLKEGLYLIRLKMTDGTVKTIKAIKK